MKILLAVFLLLLSGPAFAQDAAKPPADMKERIALATQFHKIRDLKIQINKTLDTMGESLTPEGKTKYQSEMRRVFNYKVVEDASIKAMAETFTVPELKALIDFHSKPEGRSATDKMGEYDAKLMPTLKNAVDGALTELKYPKK